MKTLSLLLLFLVFFISLGFCTQTVYENVSVECASSCKFEHISYTTNSYTILKPIYTQTLHLFFNNTFASTKFIKLIYHPPIIF